MGKRSLIFSLLVLILAMLLAACRPVADTEQPPLETVTRAPETATLPETTGAGETTGPAEATASPAASPQATDTPLPQPTPSPTATFEPQAVEVPVFASSMLDISLTATGTEVGRVRGLLVGLAGGEITYAVIDLAATASEVITGTPPTADIAASTETAAGAEPGSVLTATVTPTATVTGPPAGPGTGGNRVPVPWAAMRLARAADALQDGLVLVLQVDPMALAHAPELPPGIDELTTAEWDAGISSYWANFVNALPVTGDTDEPQPSLLIPDEEPDEIDFDVDSLAGQELGDVEDFIVSPEAVIQYAVIESDAFQAAGDELIPVPWSALHWSAVQETFLFGGSPDFLDEAPAFSPLGFPDISEPGWDEDVAAYWEGFTFPETQLNEQPAGKPAALTRVLGGATSGPRGEMLGGVSDLFLGPAGTIEYALISIRTGLFPVPYGAFDAWVGGVNLLIFGLDFDALYRAPVYGSLEDIPSPHGPDRAAWQGKVDAYWQNWVELAPEGEDINAQPDFPMLASTTLGAPVLDESGAAAGEVANLALALGRTGRIDYVIVNTGRVFIPIPWSQFDWNEADGALIFTGPAAQLMEAPSFDALDEFDIERLGRDEGLREFWAQSPGG